MYKCRHCGLEYMTDEAVMCPRCQAPKGKGTNFCPFCGSQALPGQKICSNCGVDMDHYGEVGVKSKTAAGLLGIFLGVYGVHNFYLGYYKKAVIQLVATLGSYVVYFATLFSFVLSDSYMSDEQAVGLVFGLIFMVIVVVGIRIWSFVEAILVLCGKIERDGKGRRLK